VTRAATSTGLADEQAALRRVATMVARAVPPEDVFAAVAAEVGQLLRADGTTVGRCDPGGVITVVGVWRRSGPDARAAPTIDGPAAVGVPITVAGAQWGVMSVESTGKEALPPGTEARLAGFVELIGTAIANTQARLELRAQAEEQAALRRVATLVARAAPPEAVFAAATAEVGRLLDVDFTLLSRYDPGDAATMLTTWRPGGEVEAPPNPRFRLGGCNVHTLVSRTGRSARTERADASGPAADAARGWAFHSVVGAPVNVAGRLWGVMVVAYTHDEPLPVDTEVRLGGFTELVGTALASAQTRVELRGHAEEQAALRRIATLIARAAPPDALFTAVAGEVGRLLHGGFAVLNRFDPDDTVVTVGAWSRHGRQAPFPVGTQSRLGGRNVTTQVFRTGRPARSEDYAEVDGPAAVLARERGVRSVVGAPITVGGRLWGSLSAVATEDEPLSAEAEGRLAGFAELVGTAVANAEVQKALTASRARLVAATDTARRRVERVLHDGAQQRLGSLARQLQELQSVAPRGAGGWAVELDRIAEGLTGVLDELHEIARGIHPTVLVEGGLRPALGVLARRSAVPVRLDVETTTRYPEPIEMTAYYVVSEALANAAKHAAATVLDVRVTDASGRLRVSIRDDGRGGADVAQGSGIVGLTDRVETLGGRLRLDSPAGAGTVLEADLPLEGAAAAPG
jgi:signal transduction histidine kinase